MTFFSTEFWIFIQMIITLCLIVLMLIFIKKSKPDKDNEFNAASVKTQIIKELSNILNPLLIDARNTADKIEEQLLEKKQIVHDLNSMLDRRISNLNLLISRAETCLDELDKRPQIPLEKQNRSKQMQLSPIHHSVLSLHKKGFANTEISNQLSLPMCEIELVISLNKHSM